MKEKLLILLTNDDGIHAPGLAAMKAALSGLGELWVVAPATEQSGKSHSFSLNGPLQVEKVSLNGSMFGYAVGGTPVDAVKLAVRALLPRMPDLTVSGINAGENSGVDLLYSGTVAGAMEAAVLGIPGVAVSLADKRYTDFSAAAHHGRQVCEKVLVEGLPQGIILNVNVPPLPLDQIKGVRITGQGDSYYEEGVDRREENGGVNYYWTRWAKSLSGDGRGSDVMAVREGFVSVTPVRAQLTAKDFLTTLKDWNLG